MSNLPPPRYTLVTAIKVAVATAFRALEEVRAQALRPWPGKGEQGEPGVCYDDIEHEQENDGRIEITRYLRNGKLLKEIRVKKFSVLDRGVWREAAYDKGDGVTWGGSFWIAQNDTKAKPGESDDWRLAVKRGRDGKDGKNGKAGAPGAAGPEGPRGRDLTQIMPDGSKF